jgi:hypothetical protein
MHVYIRLDLELELSGYGNSLEATHEAGTGLARVNGLTSQH